MKKILLPLGILIMSITVSAQERRLPGYYVTQDNDTIRGLIRYRNSYKEVIEFRPSNEGSSKRISMEEATAFGFTAGEAYRKVRFTEEKITKETYARLLIEGTVDLSEHQGKLLISKDGRDFHALSRVIGSTPEARFPIYQKNVGTLNLMFSGCSSVQKKGEEVSIAENSLSDLVRAYHECINKPYKVFGTPIGRKPFLIGGFAGISNTEVNFTSGNPELAAIPLSPSIQPTFGLLFLYQGKRPSPVLGFQGEISYSTASFSGEGTYENDVAGYLIRITTKTTMEYSRLAMKGGLRLTGRSNVINPYFAFGLSLYAHLSKSASMQKTTQINDGIEEQETEPDVFNSPIGVWTSAGLKKKAFGDRAIFLEAAYEFSSIDPGGRLTSLQYRLGLLF